jgi:regulator of RNase E activity RraA/type 1 glutamine amidotransferase
MSARVLILSQDDQWHKLQELGQQIALWLRKVDGIEVEASHSLQVLASDVLDTYDVCVLCTTMTGLTADQEQRLVHFARQGGAVVGIHAAAVIDEESTAYIDLIGGRFDHHPRKQGFRVEIQDKRHPVTAGIESFEIVDELYVLDGEPRGVRVLATAQWEERAQPVIYTKKCGKGHVLYNALGHDGAAHGNPVYRDLIVRGIQWACDVSTISKLLALYEGLRVTDVCDGLDAVGLIDSCTMDWEIRPLWRDVEGFGHRIYGVAHTVRFVPTSRVVPRPLPLEEYKAWKSDWYRRLAPGPREPITPGEIIVIDAAEVGDVGFIGSNNALGWIVQGARGAITNGGCRDTDELILQKVPVYSRRIARGIRPGRLEWDAENVPIACGGVRVYPGDVVVADGDGVIVVPREHAEVVAQVAREIANDDKQGRQAKYQQAGMGADPTLDPLG